MQKVKKIFSFIPKRLPHTSFDSIKELPEAVFFDYDGTISDNERYLVPAFEYAIKKNLDKKTRKEIAKINYDADKWKYIKEHFSTEIFAKCNEDYGKYIVNQTFYSIRGVRKFIYNLKKMRIKMYVVSQKDGNGLREEMKKTGIIKHFNGIFGTLDLGTLQKPSKEFMDKVKEITKTTNKNCWMIGDRCSDVVSAINLDAKAFIINKVEYQKIVSNYSNLIGKQIFFTSYKRLLKLLLKLKKTK